MYPQLSLDQIEVGAKHAVRRTISESDVYLFAGIVGDNSPWHFDEIYVQETPFKRRLVYGMLSASLFSGLIGRFLPGTIYLGQSVRFLKPVFIGDTVTAEMEILAKTEKGVVSLKTTCYNQAGEAVLEGTAEVKCMRK